MIAMSSFPSLSEKEKSRRPIVWPAASDTPHKGEARVWDETHKWGDTPSFSFDYYDKETHRVIGTATNYQDLEQMPSSNLKPIRRFIPNTWKNFFRSSKTNGEPFTLRNCDGEQCSPPVTPLLEDSRNTSFEEKSSVHSRSSSSFDIKQEIKKPLDSLERRSQQSTNYGEKRMDRPKRIVFQDEVEHLGDMKGKVIKTIDFSKKGSDTGALNCSIPTGHRQNPHVIADYVLKYPKITSARERESYKAVFNDQYAEYKVLYREVRTAMLKFKELDATMAKLTHGPQSQKAPERIQAITQKYEQKKNDPGFKEKRERCIYLKEKLTHIKKQIQAYDQQEGSVYF